MPFTMPNFQPLTPEQVNPLSGVISGLLKGAQTAPEIYKSYQQAKYAPLTLQADAYSKLAYASLMGPQYIAKLLSNPDIAAQLGDEQIAALLKTATTPAINNSINPISLALRNQKPGEAVTNTSNQAVEIPSNNINRGYEYDKNGQNVTATETEINALANTPVTKEDEKWGKYQKNVARARGIAAQGEEAGKLRAQDADKLNTTVLDAQNDLANLNLIGQDLIDPEMEKIKTFPIGGHFELAYYAAKGTPRQKELIGNIRTGLKNSILGSSTQFKGAFRPGEQQLLESGLPNENDTLDTMKGKWEATTQLKKMLLERSKTVAKLESNGIDKSDAIDIADQMVNGDQIRKAVHAQMYPKKTINMNGIEYTFKNGKFYKNKGE